MFENPRRGRQARDFTTNAPKILDLKSSSEQIFSRKLPLGAPEFLRMEILCINIKFDVVGERPATQKVPQNWGIRHHSTVKIFAT